MPENRISLSPRRLSTGLAAGRVAIGAVMATDPTLLGRLLGIDRVTARRTSWLTGMTAARELGLGVGTLAAVASGGDVRPWLVAQAISDGGDAVAIAAAIRRGDVRRVLGALVVATAVGGAVAGAVAAVRR